MSLPLWPSLNFKGFIQREMRKDKRRELNEKSKRRYKRKQNETKQNRRILREDIKVDVFFSYILFSTMLRFTWVMATLVSDRREATWLAETTWCNSIFLFFPDAAYSSKWGHLISISFIIYTYEPTLAQQERIPPRSPRCPSFPFFSA